MAETDATPLRIGLIGRRRLAVPESVPDYVIAGLVDRSVGEADP